MKSPPSFLRSPCTCTSTALLSTSSPQPYRRSSSWARERIVPGRSMSSCSSANSRGESGTSAPARVTAGAAAQQRADARRELAEVEGLDEVVVRAGVEARDAVGHRVARGEDQHRDREPALALAAQQREAVAPREPEVEQQQLEGLAAEHRFGGARLVHPVDREALALQARAQRLADHRVVLYQQQSHGAQSMMRRGPPRLPERALDPVETLLEGAQALAVP